jgi:hypothetical protein
MLGQVPQARIAGCQFRPGIADANDRTTVKYIIWKPLALHPAAVDKAITVELAIGTGASERFTSHGLILCNPPS